MRYGYKPREFEDTDRLLTAIFETFNSTLTVLDFDSDSLNAIVDVALSLLNENERFIANILSNAIY